MDIILLVKLSARAWSLPILAAFHRGVAGRQAPLLTATGAGRTAFAASLEHLIELGLVERNPGHGHPLRPEFRLTEKGRAAAEAAGEIYGVVSDDAGAAVLRRSWTLPILALTGAP
ncbi:MAG: winged helix-turn-helix transcriptional regulator, partial [Rhodobacteraceae bacterium]|nr:winged helix-turn-helix transcriptional regulator [Paracoccaceae bacterium]